MNFELKYLETNNFLLNGKIRKIKLRKLSFSNVINKWLTFEKNNSDILNKNSNTNLPEYNNHIDITKEKSKMDIIKLPINNSNLSQFISLIDTNWGQLDSIKRRALALNKDMYQNMINNVKLVYKDDEYNDNINDINEEEIKQAVKDAFDQINFNKEDVEAEVMISPEEVSNTISESDTSIEESSNSSISFNEKEIIDNKPEEDSKFTLIDDSKDNITESKFKEENVFKFGDINLENINTKNTIPDSKNELDKKENKFIVTNDDSEDNNTLELQDLLNKAQELKNQQEEQQKKTQNAHKLALEKEEEKNKVKADFISYQAAIKEALERSKKEEELELEKARKAEEFTTALVDIMNNAPKIKN